MSDFRLTPEQLDAIGRKVWADLAYDVSEAIANQPTVRVIPSRPARATRTLGPYFRPAVSAMSPEAFYAAVRAAGVAMPGIDEAWVAQQIARREAHRQQTIAPLVASGALNLPNRTKSLTPAERRRLEAQARQLGIPNVSQLSDASLQQAIQRAMARTFSDDERRLPPAA